MLPSTSRRDAFTHRPSITSGTLATSQPLPSLTSSKTLTISHSSPSLIVIHLAPSSNIILHNGNDPPAQQKQWPANTVLCPSTYGPNPLCHCASDVGLQLSLQSPLQGCGRCSMARICCGTGTNERARSCAAAGAGCKYPTRRLFLEMSSQL